MRAPGGEGEGDPARGEGPRAVRAAPKERGGPGKRQPPSGKGKGARGKKKRSRGRKGKGGKGSPSGPAPAGRDEAGETRDPGESPESGEGPPSGEDRETGEDRGRPTPVRDAMEGVDAEPPSEGVPTRRFEREGVQWTVRAEGRTHSGRAADAGALLLHLRFYRGDAAEPERHAVVAALSLQDFYDAELADLLDRARPWGPPKPFYEDSEEGRRRRRGR